MDPALTEEIIAILDDPNDMTIATVREDGYPQATTGKRFAVRRSAAGGAYCRPTRGGPGMPAHVPEVPPNCAQCAD